MKTTLLIMAAGIGSRFGTGIKQLEPVDASNHIIMDYSIHDAIEAGFNRVVFIIRKDIEKEFKEVIGDRITSICSSHNVVFCKHFLEKNAKYFWRMLHLQIGESCKALTGSCSASHKPLQIIFSCYSTRYGNGSSEFSSSCACFLK